MGVLVKPPHLAGLINVVWTAAISPAARSMVPVRWGKHALQAASVLIALIVPGPFAGQMTVAAVIARQGPVPAEGNVRPASA